MKIGVFDSGIGGNAVAQRLQELIPNATIIFVSDHDHVPYGIRPESEIIELTNAAIQPLFEQECDVIVIACNTATTVAIKTLRERYPQMPFVGIEPMVKPAAEITKTRSIAILATPATLASDRYAELKELYAPGVTIIEPDCSSWADLIENEKSDHVPIEVTVTRAIEQGADVIVLACTHYHWLKDRAVKAADTGVTVLEPSDAIARRIKSILKLAN